MSPTYSSFAITGAGVIGAPIAEALISKGVKVVILTRSASNKAFPANAIIEEVTYDSKESIQAALDKHAVEVVISTLSFTGFVFQNNIADAAKAAGVKLFVPSEFGLPTLGHTEGIWGVKDEFARYLKSIALPSARFFVGYFTGQIPWVTGYAVNGKINIIGQGKNPITFTAEEDIAGFVVHVLTEHPIEVSQDKVFRIQGARHSFRELADIFKTEAVHVDTIPGLDPAVTATLQKKAELGLGSTGRHLKLGGEGEDAADSSNYLWPEHHWKTVQEVCNVA
ncbi:hypothetical protein ONZ45_g14298 [Pleurotus djamor]|nr:hypothetical protein ONZ45_g14298 [Pleurotus djamor]